MTLVVICVVLILMLSKANTFSTNIYLTKLCLLFMPTFYSCNTLSFHCPKYLIRHFKSKIKRQYEFVDGSLSIDLLCVRDLHTRWVRTLYAQFDVEMTCKVTLPQFVHKGIIYLSAFIQGVPKGPWRDYG